MSDHLCRDIIVLRLSQHVNIPGFLGRLQIKKYVVKLHGGWLKSVERPYTHRPI